MHAYQQSFSPLKLPLLYQFLRYLYFIATKQAFQISFGFYTDWLSLFLLLAFTKVLSAIFPRHRYYQNDMIFSRVDVFIQFHLATLLFTI